MKPLRQITVLLTLLALSSGHVLAVGPSPRDSSGQQAPPIQAPPKPRPSAPPLPGPTIPTTPAAAAAAAEVADLSVEDIVVQRLGAGAFIQVTVKNVGRRAADASQYRLQVLLDGRAMEGGDQPLPNPRNPIPPNQGRSTGFIPARAGNIDVTARLIPSGGYAGDNAANNSLTRRLNLPEVPPDYTVASFSLTGDNLLQITIRNRGGYAAAEARGRLDVFVDNDRVESIVVSEWPRPGENKGFGTTARIAGQHNVRATINPDRAVREMDYQNNTLAQPMTGQAFRPDLVVKQLGRMPIPASRQDPVGATRLVVIVENTGRAATPQSFKADVFLANRLLETLTLAGPIDRGAEKRFETRIPIEGTGEYRVTVDPLNAIDEQREDNNSREETQRAYVGAELHPQAVSVASGEIRVTHPDGSTFRAVPCSAAWPYVRVRVTGWYRYGLPSMGDWTGIFGEGNSRRNEAEGHLPLLMNDVDRTPYQKSGDTYDYMLECTASLNIKLNVRDTNYSDNEQISFRAEIFVPSANDVSRWRAR